MSTEIAERTQTYFRPDVSGGHFEIAPDLVEPEFEDIPKFAQRAIELSHRIVEGRNRDLFDEVTQRWFRSKFGPDIIAKSIFKDFIDPERAYWSPTHPEARLGSNDIDAQGKKILIEFASSEQITTKEAVDEVEDIFELFENLADDLEYRHFTLDSENHILLYDDFPIRFKKQLAIAGIFTHSQYDYLTVEQIREIKRIRVPSKLWICQTLEEQVEELKKHNIKPPVSKN